MNSKRISKKRGESPKQGHTKDNSIKLSLQKKRIQLCDDDFWKEVRNLYTYLDIDEQIIKMKGYQLTRKGKNWRMTTGSVIRWLNRQDKPLEVKAFAEKDYPKFSSNPERDYE